MVQLQPYNFATVEAVLSDGGNFTALNAQTAPKVIAGGICEPATINTSYGAFWSGDVVEGGGTWPADQYSEIAIKTIASGTILVPIVRASAIASTYYQVNLTGSGSTQQVFATVAGVATQIGSNFTATPAAGDVWRITVTGSTITVTQNGTQKFTGTDTNIVSGSPGFALYQTTAITSAQINGWAAGGNQAATPTITKSGTSVTISSSTAGGTVYYTTDGTVPTHSSSSIANGGTIIVTGSNLVRAFVSVSNYGDSQIGVFYTGSTGNVEPPTLVQYVTSHASSANTRTVAITYQTGDAVLVFAADGAAHINGVTDSGGSSFIPVGSPTYWTIFYTQSAIASTGVTVTNCGIAEFVNIIVAVFRGVSAIGVNSGYTTNTSSTIAVSSAISAGSKLVGMLGVGNNGAGTVTLTGDASGKTVNGDLIVTIGNGNNTGPIIGLIDSDTVIGSAATLNLQVTASRSSLWSAVSIELMGTPQTYWLNKDLYVIGDIIDSDGVIHSAVTNTVLGLTLTGQKGSFPCIPQNGGSPVTQTYAMGHISTRFSFTYGTVEAVIKFAGIGVHDVLWMLGVPCRPWANYASSSGSPNPPGGEIDIAEFIQAQGLSSMRQAIFNPTLSSTDTPTGFDISADFHTYKLVWTNSAVTWYVDGSQVKTVSTQIPNYPFYVIVGGYMGEGGWPITDGLLPSSMIVKSLKITDANGAPVSNTGNADVIPGLASDSLMLMGVGG